MLGPSSTRNEGWRGENTSSSYGSFGDAESQYWFSISTMNSRYVKVVLVNINLESRCIRMLTLS